MRIIILLVCLYTGSGLFSQTITDKLSLAFSTIEADSQCRHGIISLHVLDSRSGNVIFNKNEDVGLAPASCQKIITSATALDLLGKDYRYKTTIGYDGKIKNGILSGNIIVTGSGDPTLGSWRYQGTKEELVLENFKNATIKAGINEFTGAIFSDSRLWDSQAIPDGWIWQDIGNYYGAGAYGLNWRENQYDIVLQSGSNEDDSVKVIAIVPPLIQGVTLINELTSGKKGSGDNAYIYLPTRSSVIYVRGTIPVNESHFIISGALPDASAQLIDGLYNRFHGSVAGRHCLITENTSPSRIIFTHTSPILDSINYWFMKKSINLYGEALVKTISYQKINFGSADSGINIIRDFWDKHGVEKTALRMVDGSGLSPGNRITTSSLTTVLQFAKRQKWFFSFYNALPEINGIKMKSGSISGVQSYAGYIKSSAGNEYTFAFIINNFNGSASLLRKKMWKVLDGLK